MEMTKVNIASASLLAAITVLLLTGYTAPNVYAMEQTYAIGEVVVKADAPGVESVGSTFKVDAETISRRGSKTLNEALNLVPGVMIRTGNDGTPRIDIRGYRTRNVLLLLDGIPINSTFDGQFDPASIPVEHIAEIKVTTGSSSVLYGAGGNGGVINIITKKGQSGVHGKIVGEAGSNDAYIGRVSLGASNGKFDAFISSSAAERDGFSLANDFDETADENGGLRENSDRENDHLFGSLGYALSENSLVGISLDYNKGEYGKPPVTNYDRNDPFTKKPKYERIDDEEGFAGQVALSQRFSDALSLRGWAFYNTLDVEENRYDDSSYDRQRKKGSYHSNATTDIVGGSVQVTYDAQRAGSTTIGLSTQRESWEDSGFELVRDNVSKEIDSDENVDIYSAALEYTVSPLENLTLVFGYGQHYQDRKGNTEDAYSYLIGASYDLFAGTRLRASHARKVRFPSIKQLYEVKGGNSDLEAERSLNYEIGIEQQLPAATTLSVSLFHNDAKDFIEKDDSDVNNNFEDYRFRGAEIVVENRAMEALLLRACYSYLDAQDRSKNSQKDDLQYRPQDTVSLEAEYTLPFDMVASASLLYVANQYFYDADGRDPLEKQRLPEYLLVNAKIDQAIMNRAIHLYAGVDNLFDEDYEQSYGVPQAGRTWYGGVEYHF